ncbi:MAG: threonine/serine exporter family protein [Clostridia bacterium]|nr:threonine/serine exporter family protein [Clostridia bacterium]
MTFGEYNSLLSLIMDIAKLMLVSGAEVYRVEDTVMRLVCAYGGTKPQVTAVPSNIIVTCEFEGTEHSSSRRINNSETDMELLDRLNNLSREMCASTPDLAKARAMFDAAVNKKEYTPFQLCLAYAFTSAAFTLFFKGIWLDALASLLIGGLLYWVKRAITAQGGGNKVFVVLLGGAFTALMAAVCVRLGLGRDADKVIIGVVMLLVPGIELLNGFRDFISGDIQAGVMHISEALFLGIVLALGAAGVFTVAGKIGL